MQSLVFSNDNGSITIGQTAPNYLILVDGISGLGANVISQQAPFQDGDTYISSNFNRRNITFTFVTTATDLTALNALKRNITNIFNPKLERTLTYTNGAVTKQCTVHCEKAPVFSSSDKSDQHQIIFISLIANNPFWLDTTDSSKEMAISIPMFSFDLEIIEPYEIEVDGINSVDIDNIGDVETPVIIYFNGPATNPKVTNETTGEYIEVAETLLANERLIINTEFGNKSVSFDDGTGVFTNAFGKINLNSTFFQLRTGINTITYTCDTGIDTTNVRLVYRNRFITP